MKYLSLFSGIGGFELGIQRAFDNKTPQHDERIQDNEVQSIAGSKRTGTPHSLCIGYSEIDKYAIKVYERHFKHENYGDATRIVPEELPDFDLLVGGFPCQAFSIAGKRAGFDDTRGTLFFDILRILKDKRPRHLVLENVKGLLSHDSGKTFQTIIGLLTDTGYRVEWQVLNSKDFGVPQNRERVFIVGHLRGECGRQIFPITGSSQQIATVAGYISEEVWPRRHEQIRRVYKTDGAMPTIPTGQGGGVMTKIAVDLTRRAEDNHRVRKDGRAGTLDANYYKGLANQERPGVKEGLRIRRLTPIECERLMGFPDGWTAGEKSSIMGICANINPAIEKQLLKSDIVYSTISGGKDMEVQLSRNSSSLPVFAVDGLVPETYVTDTTKVGNDTVTHYSQSEILNTVGQQKVSDTLEKTAEKSTAQLWKIVLEENLPKEKLSTTLTSIHAIMTSPIFTSVKTVPNITGYIISLKPSLPSYTNEGRLSFQVATILPISDTQRYKMCGNAVVTNVVVAVMTRLVDCLT